MVIVVLAMISAIVVPRIKSMESSREYRNFRLGLRRIAMEGREQAISRGSQTRLALDESQPSITVLAVGEDGQESPLETLPIPAGVGVVRMTVAGTDSSASEWRVANYPDGTSDGGGVEFEAGSDSFYLAAEQDGTIVFGEGSLPDQAAKKWEAGEREQRQ